MRTRSNSRSKKSTNSLYLDNFSYGADAAIRMEQRNASSLSQCLQFEKSSGTENEC